MRRDMGAIAVTDRKESGHSGDGRSACICICSDTRIAIGIHHTAKLPTSHFYARSKEAGWLAG